MNSARGNFPLRSANDCSTATVNALKDAQAALDKAKSDVAQQANDLNNQAAKAVGDAKEAMGKTSNFVDVGLQDASAAIRAFTVAVEQSFADLKGKLPRAEFMNLVQLSPQSTDQQMDKLTASAGTFANDAEKVASQVANQFGAKKAEGDKADQDLKDAKAKGDAELAQAMQGVKAGNDGAASEVGDIKNKLGATLSAVGQTKASSLQAMDALKTKLNSIFDGLEAQFPKN
jgi:hypothetical protein